MQHTVFAGGKRAEKRAPSVALRSRHCVDEPVGLGFLEAGYRVSTGRSDSGCVNEKRQQLLLDRIIQG